jgi:hypothetical protein
MAEEITAPQSQTSPADLDVDIDAALAALPELAEVFGAKQPKETQPAPKEPAQGGEAEQASVIEEEPEVAPEQPKEEPQPEPPKEEPAIAERDNVQKRIDKLVAQKKSAEESVAKLTAELAEMKEKASIPSIDIRPTAEDPLANVFTPDEMERRRTAAQHVQSWAMRNLNGGEVRKADGSTGMLNDEEVRDMWARAADMLTVHLPNREKYLNQKAHYDQEAARAYPELFRMNGESFKAYMDVLRQFPAVLARPDHSIHIGDMLYGQRQRLSKASRNGNSQAHNTPPQLQRAAPSSAPRAPQKTTLTGADLTPIANGDGDVLDQYIYQLIDEAAAKRAQR